MNTIKIILTLTLAAFTTLTLTAQNDKESRKAAKQQQEAVIAQQIDSLIKAGTLTIEIDRISPTRGPSKTTTDGYTLNINNNTLNTYLPYIGQATSISFSTDNLSINIKDQPITLDTQTNKKGTHTLRFTADNNNTNERCEFYIEIFNNGTSSINIQFPGRDPITYYGNIKQASN